MSVSENGIAKRKKHPKPDDFVPEAIFPEGHRLAGKQRCKAWSVTQGRQCRRTVVPTYNVCDLHGGKTPRGVDSPHFKTGKFSKSLPDRLAVNYEQALSNPDIVSLKEEIALVDAHMLELVEKLRTGGDSTNTWRLLGDTLMRFRSAKRDDVKAGFLDQILKLIEQGITESMIWDDIYESIAQRRRLVDTEYKRMVQYGHMLNIEQLMSIIGALLSVIKRYVDRDTYSKISGELRGLVSKDSGSQPGAVGAALPAPGRIS